LCLLRIYTKLILQMNSPTWCKYFGNQHTFRWQLLYLTELNKGKGTRLPELSESSPKYPLLKPALASAIPSNNPIKTTEKLIAFK
jgi:hypothetical protein